MTVMIRCFGTLACVLMLQGCITKVVTVPVKVAYGTTKAVVKGTAAVVGAVIPDGDDEKDEKKKDD
ncbi:NF038104 family lipoprotein [Acinetobacter ursingii]|uniref:NF038104 family lipoprotein n=1 Tax=Acinetobacter ursingii TaxID=108980 RepID=UPI0032B3D728